MHLYLAIQTARNKLEEQINCLRSLKSKFFAVGPRRGLGANARVKRPEYALIVSFMGVCGRKSGGKVFLALKVSLWAMHEELKKQKREKQRTKAFEANIFMAIKTQYI